MEEALKDKGASVRVKRELQELVSLWAGIPGNSQPPDSLFEAAHAGLQHRPHPCPLLILCILNLLGLCPASMTFIDCCLAGVREGVIAEGANRAERAFNLSPTTKCALAAPSANQTKPPEQKQEEAVQNQKTEASSKLSQRWSIMGETSWGLTWAALLLPVLYQVWCSTLIPHRHPDLY